jgi:hypothetical protein
MLFYLERWTVAQESLHMTIRSIAKVEQPIATDFLRSPKVVPYGTKRNKYDSPVGTFIVTALTFSISHKSCFMYGTCPKSKDTKVLNIYNIFNLQKRHCE